MINRKNTILLAVLINAGLLVVLCITALTSKEEIAPAPAQTLAEAPAPLPLFGEELKMGTQTSSELIAMAPTPASASAPVMHALPPLVPEAAPVPMMAPPVSTHMTEIPVAAAPAPVAAPAPAAVAPKFQEVIVKKGETLDKIAKAHRTTVDEIIKMNHLSSSFLRVGQIVKVPSEKGGAPKAQVAAAAPVDKGSDYYVVKVGDNPWTIAMKHHLKVDELLKLNGLNEQKAKKLKPGDRLRVRKE